MVYKNKIKELGPDKYIVAPEYLSIDQLANFISDETIYRTVITCNTFNNENNLLSEAPEGVEGYFFYLFEYENKNIIKIPHLGFIDIENSKQNQIRSTSKFIRADSRNEGIEKLVEFYQKLNIEPQKQLTLQIYNPLMGICSQTLFQYNLKYDDFKAFHAQTERNV